MSDRNPLSIIKRQANSAKVRAYHIKKLTGTDEIVDYVEKEINEILSPKLKMLVIREWIRRLIVGKREPAFGAADQIDFFIDLDELFTVNVNGGSKQIALGDFSIPDMEAVDTQKVKNLSAVTRELERYRNACAQVRPLLEANPGWRWRDAIKRIKGG